MSAGLDGEDKGEETADDILDGVVVTCMNVPASKDVVVDGGYLARIEGDGNGNGGSCVAMADIRTAIYYSYPYFVGDDYYEYLACYIKGKCTVQRIRICIEDPELGMCPEASAVGSSKSPSVGSNLENDIEADGVIEVDGVELARASKSSTVAWFGVEAGIDREVAWVPTSTTISWLSADLARKTTATAAGSSDSRDKPQEENGKESASLSGESADNSNWPAAAGSTVPPRGDLVTAPPTATSVDLKDKPEEEDDKESAAPPSGESACHCGFHRSTAGRSRNSTTNGRLFGFERRVRRRGR